MKRYFAYLVFAAVVVVCLVLLGVPSVIQAQATATPTRTATPTKTPRPTQIPPVKKFPAVLVLSDWTTASNAWGNIRTQAGLQDCSGVSVDVSLYRRESGQYGLLNCNGGVVTWTVAFGSPPSSGRTYILGIDVGDYRP
mgnify:CR=1 FL=1